MKLTINRLTQLEAIFEDKNWEIVKDEDKFASIFNRFCNRLGIYDEEKQDLILELTSDFLNLTFNDLQLYFINSLSHITNIDSYKIIIICPLKQINEKKTKSSDHLWYHLKNFCDFSYQTYRKKIGFISEWDIIKTQAKSDTLVILVDDYIGTGNTVNDAVDSLLASGHLSNKFNYKVLSLIATEKGIENITNRHGDIAVCGKLVNRGIADKYTGEELIRKTQLMTEMESHLKVLPEFIFGYGQSESLVAIQNKAPNNTFPIFWLEKKNKLAPFKK